MIDSGKRHGFLSLYETRKFSKFRYFFEDWMDEIGIIVKNKNFDLNSGYNTRSQRFFVGIITGVITVSTTKGRESKL